MHRIALRLKLAAVLSLLFLTRTGAQSFDLSVPKTARATKRVVTLGHIAQQGRFTDDRPPMMSAGASRIRPQCRVRSYWPDGSYRWIHLTFEVRLAPGKPRTVTIRRSAMEKGLKNRASPFTIKEAGSGLQIDNGLIRFEIEPDPRVVLKRCGFVNKARPVLQSLILGLPRDEGELTIEEKGPHQLVVLHKGLICQRTDGATVTMHRRISLGAHSTELVIDTWLQPITTVLPEGGFDYEFALSAPANRVRDHQRWRRVKKVGLPLRLEFGRNGYSRMFSSVATIEDPPDRLSLCMPGSALSFSLDHFSELRPSFMELTSSSKGRIGLVSGYYRWHLGVRPTRRLVIALANKSSRLEMTSVSRVQVQAKDASPALGLGSRSAAPLADSEKVKALIRSVLVAELAADHALKRGFIWPGEESFGDWRWNKTDAGNLEYDTTWGLRAASHYLQDRRLLTYASDCARHLMMRDIGDSGLPLMHGAHHRYGGLEAGHMWLDGLLAETVLSGDPFLADCLEQLLEAWCTVAPRLARGHLNTRSLAWSILFAAAAHRGGKDKVGGDILAQLNRRIIDAPGLTIPLFDAIPKARNIYRVTPWVVVGILGEALHAAPRNPGADAAESRFLAAADQVLDVAWRGPELGLASSFSISGHGHAASVISGTASGEEALIFALGLGRAAQMSGNRALMKKAQEVASWASQNLTVGRGRFSGMRLSQLLWVYPRLFGLY